MKDIIFEALIFVAMLATLAFFVVGGLCFVFNAIVFTEGVAIFLAICAGAPLIAIIAADEIKNF